MIFKTNDIRGIYPTELNEDIVYRIGFYLPELTGTSAVVVGRDGRSSSPSIFKALGRGIRDAGADIIHIGVCDTPAVSFAQVHYGYEAAVMITASHNPPEYNGLKISGSRASPIGLGSGLERLSLAINRPPVAKKKSGIERRLDIAQDYVDYLHSYNLGIEGLRCVFDCGNGAAGSFIEAVFKNSGIDYAVLFQEIDGTFPNRGPDPLDPQNREKLRRSITERGADLGVCFDGDADRAIFIDNNGEFVSPGTITALLAHYFSYRNTDEQISALYDIRSSNGVREYIQKLGGKALSCPTGHARIKNLLKEKNYLWGGELSGHYYYRDNNFCDSAFITVMAVLSVLSRTRRSLASFRAEIQRYAFSGEINFSAKDIPDLLRRLEERFSDGMKDYTDGLRVDYPDWWFIVRKSNAEPLIRLVVEAKKNSYNAREGRLPATIIIQGSSFPGSSRSGSIGYRRGGNGKFYQIV